jgi:uncharacterized protein (TIGR02646 family)
MRDIVKGDEPESFTAWKALANEDWIPSFDDLSGQKKRDVYAALIKEQREICSYCERELKGKDYHLEHLNPQAAHDGDDLDFNNFLCSCLNKTAKGDPLHCGQEKGNQILPIHPLQSNCQQKFTFTGDGKIKGVDDAASQTIEILALDLGKLNDLRENVLEPFLDPDLTDQEFDDFVKEYIEDRDKSKPFLSAVEFVFRDYI